MDSHSAAVTDTGAREEWAQNWRVVLASAIAICFTILHFYTLGVFLEPLSKAYGWTKSDITWAPIAGPILFFFIARRVGRFLDRQGVRRVGLPGFAAYCVALAMLGLAGPQLWTWYALWVLLAVVLPFCNNNVWSLAVARRFQRSRGLALAVALCGTGVASAIAPYATAVGIERFGWSMTYHLLGLAALVIGLPLLYLLLPRGQAPGTGTGTGAGPGAAAASDAATALPGYTFSEALRTRPFWILVFAAAVLGYGMPTLMLHFVSIGIENGISSQASAAAAGIIGVAAIVGRLTAGVLLDTLPGKFVAAFMFGAPAIACAILLNVDGSLMTLSIAAAVIGLCTGAEFDVLAVLVSRHMGMREFGAINGQIASVFGLGVGFGPALSSMIYDASGSYGTLLMGMALAFVLPALAVLFIGTPRFYRSPRQEAEVAPNVQPAE